jgi:hypothetical protein
MNGFALVQSFNDFYSVIHDGRRVAILFPARPYVQADVYPAQQALPWSIVPDPEAFPDAACVGLPAPLCPWGNRFDSFDEVLRLLGLEQERAAA